MHQALTAAFVASQADPHGKLDALQRFRAAIRLDRWPIIENVLLQQALAWPMLVLPSSTGAVHTSLPLSITTHRGGVPQDKLADSTLRVYFPSQAIIEHDQWTESVARSLDAAIDRWIQHRRHWGTIHLQAVRQTAVTVDLRLAEAIVDAFRATPLLSAPPGTPSLKVSGASAELYFALYLYAQLTGDSSMQTTCATGEAAYLLPDPQGGGDCHLIEPAFVKAKIEGARDTYLFDTMAIAATPGRYDSVDHLQVITGERLSAIITQALHRPNSLHRFVRCPDLTSNKGPEESDSKQTKRLLALLRANKGEGSSPVFEAPQDVRPIDVARALYRLNVQAHVLAKAQGTSEDEGESAKQMGTWLVVRAVPDETNERFWQTVFSSLEAPTDVFDKFRLTLSPAGAARILAATLNQFEYVQGTMRRAPDLLVVVGFNRLGEEDGRFPHGPFSRLKPRTVLSNLVNYVLPPRNEIQRELIGRTRVLLVQEGEHDPAWPTLRILPPVQPKSSNVCPRPAETLEAQSVDPATVQRAFEKLSIFRDGFTTQMARRLLNTTDSVCDRILEALRQFKVGPTDLLSFVVGAGEYLLHARYDGSGHSPEELCELHCQAADSIAGFIGFLEGEPSFNYRQALAPQWLHEAQWHLDRGLRLLASGDKRALKIGRASRRLSRAGETTGWTSIRHSLNRATQDGTESLYAAQRLMEGQYTGYLAHPHEYTLLARYSRRIWKSCAKADRDELERNRLDWDQLLSRAERACANLLFDDVERAKCSMLVATDRACGYMTAEPNWAGYQRAEHDVRTALDLRRRHEDAVEDRQWFEFIGDSYTERAQEGAALEYKRGIFNRDNRRTETPRRQTIIKYLGACALARMWPDPNIVDFVKSVDWADFRPPVSGLHELLHVQERWRVGLSEIEKVFRAAERQRRYNDDHRGRWRKN